VKYIIQIIGGLGLLAMLNMCVQAGMLSHEDTERRAAEAAAGGRDSGHLSYEEMEKGASEIEKANRSQSSYGYTDADLDDPAPNDSPRDSE
jgi:hypothetical protein